jgi:DNA-binding transcriptional LysR family regulator
VRLFDRAVGRISLTRHGSVLVGYASKITTLASDAERELGEDGETSGELSRGVSTTIAQYILQRVQNDATLCNRLLTTFSHASQSSLKPFA